MQGIRIEPTIAVFPPTYISEVSRSVVKIENTTESLFKISFHNFPSTKEEEAAKAEIDLLDPEQRENLHKTPVFTSKYFTITPSVLELWPHSFQQIVCEFHPAIETKYTETAYIQLNNSTKRYKFDLQGTGLPPVACFLTDNIIVGHINLETVLDYVVELKNTGQVPVDFTYEPKQSTIDFDFSPKKGIIPVDEVARIKIRLYATNVGVFSETFVYKVKGATHGHPTITFNGKILGPTFVINPKRINFGNVGYGFLHTEKMEIENKSDIPFDFKLHLSHDGSFERREFQIQPEVGSIPKFSKAEISLEFIPIAVRPYNLMLYLDIKRVGESLAEIPIQAICFCPSLSILPETLDFDNIFVGYRYSKTIKLQNNTEFAAKFDFISPTAISNKIGTVEVDKISGIVNPHEFNTVTVSFTGIRIGPLTIECFFSIFGSDDPPLKLTIIAVCTGPSLDISPQNISFGNIKILETEEKKLMINNNSLIPANFKTMLDPPSKNFKVDPPTGVIAPNEAFALRVTANVNDILTFASNLKLQFEYLNTINIALKATGVGSPIASDINMDVIDFGYILTEHQSTRPFYLTNYAERSYEIRWTCTKPKIPKDAVASIQYSISPEFYTITPKETATFVISLQSPSCVSFTINTQCHSTVNRTRTEIFHPVIKGQFVQPLIQFSSNVLEFKQSIETLDDNRDYLTPSQQLLKIIENTLSLTNKSKLSLTIDVDCPEPFSISQNHFTIDPQKAITLDLYFDPTFKTDFVSEIVVRKITFFFMDHPQKLTVTAKGYINFPNIHFSSTEPIDFGVAMMNTEQTRTIELTNKFDSSIHYEWELMANNEKQSKAFDVFPVKGEIDPNQTIENHFNFFALKDPSGKLQNFNATAVCHVRGGPDYQIQLSGTSATIQYKVEPLLFEIGQMNYTQEVQKVLTLTNDSKVPIKFSIKIPKRCRFQSFIANPTMGTISASSTADVTLLMVPGHPSRFHENLFVQIGGFEEIQVTINLEASFCQVLSSLKRDDDDPSIKSFNGKSYTQESLLLMEEKLLNNQINFKQTKPSFVQDVMDAPLLYVASYVIDFEDLILGEQKKESFTFTNKTCFPISFEFNVDNLKRTGFRIEPAIYKDIPGNSEVNIDAYFNPASRRNNEIGPVSYEVPVKFNDDHMILLTIKGVLMLPDLTFSDKHFEFDDVIIGQSKVMTLQLQNMNNVSCEYKFEDPQLIVQSQSSKCPPQAPPNVFSVVPDTGILPPSSFMNIAIHFSPDSDKPVQMQYPINLKYAPQPFYITVSGHGVPLSLVFEPKELVLPSVQPFSPPSTAEVTVINPTDYPIEFYSLQFDQLLFNEETNDPRQAESPFVTYTPKAKTPIHASKFAVCFIIDGPPLSGKTTIANRISEMYHLPIINLAEIWKDTTEYGNKLYTTLCDPIYRSGFIVDGLFAIEEGNENEVFLNQCLKAKNAVEYSTSIIPHQQLSTYERVLDILLNSLDGHYVFHLALKIPNNEIDTRKEEKTKREQRQRRKELKEEKDRIFNMTEDEYNALSDEERAVVDKRRTQFRNKMIGTPPEKEENPKKKKRTREEVQKTGRSSKKEEQPPSKQPPRGKKIVVPTDHLQLLGTTYSFAYSSIVHLVNTKSEHFKVLDPKDIVREIKGIPILNSLLIEANSSTENIIDIATSFLPSMNLLKEFVFKKQIPEAFINDDLIQPEGLKKRPVFFSVATGDDLSQKLTQRWNLNPNSQMSLKIVYDPFMPAVNTDELFFAIARSAAPPIGLKVKGTCEYPEISRNPNTLFPTITKKFDPKSPPSYISETGELNFGYVLICKSERTNAKAPMQYRTPVKVTNTSTTFPAEISTVFSDPLVTKNIWMVEQPTFVLQPGTSSEMMIGFHPTTAGVFKTKLFVVIKDNPEPLTINIVAECCVPDLVINSSTFDFEKILVNTEKAKKIEIKNNGKIPASWKLKGLSSLSNVTFNATEGVVQPRGNFIIIAKFQSAKPIQIKKQISLEVTDLDGKRTFQTHQLQVNAEAFDVNFDVLVPKTNNEQLNFGQLKVGQSKVLQIQLKNRGKYPVHYKFAITDKVVMQFITIAPLEGVSPPGDKGTNINVTFLGTSVVKFATQKGIHLKVFDTQTNAITTNQSFTFCAQTFYNNFSLSCGKTLNFGICQSGVIQRKEITITNLGVFPFDYELHQRSMDEPLPTSKGKKVVKSKPKAQNALIVGPYSITNPSGLINPQQSVVMQVEFVSNESGKFKQSVYVIISDTNDGNYVLNLSAQVYAPSLAPLKDTVKIFTKLPLIMRADLNKSDVTSYLEDEKTLHFSPRVLNTKDQITMNMINPVPIDCTCDISIKPRGKGNVVPFDCDQKTLTVPANSQKQITISFSPTQSDNFLATFEAIVRSSTPAQPVRMNIEGVGTIPSISLRTQIDKSKNGFVVNMGKTLIGYDKTKSITIGNDTPITANVTMTMKPNPDFSIIGIQKNKFTVDPSRQMTFTIKHSPQTVRKGQFDVSFSVEDNPKSNLQISFVAEGFSEDIVFEGLEGEDNEIHFRDAVVGRTQTITFNMRNVSDSCIRFMWNSSSDITFSPRVGHLQRNQVKEISAMFFSEKPTKYMGTKGSCQITKIRLADPNAEDWDDSKKVVTFVPIEEIQSPRDKEQISPSKEMKKIITVSPEPAYNALMSKPKELPLKLFVMADFIKCTFDPSEIAYAPTMMFQQRIAEFKLTNTCQIRLEYHWILEKFEALKTDYTSSKPPAFSIEPQTGYVEAGQTGVFKVAFSPLEVDDFIGKFRCAIPYLTTEQPVISVNGLSRRPLCHFNVVVSDYLTRRHPEFTYQLPEGVKVIEIFSRAVRVRIQKKLEIINPTSSPYDTTWSLLADNSEGSIECENKSALVSSGKHYHFIVNYMPKSPRIVESLWEFSIPEHSIKIPFLFVGRLSH